MACQASLSSSMKAVLPDGSTRVLNQGLNSFSLPKGTKIEYTVKTLSDGKGKSDKFSFQVIAINFAYIENVTKMMWTRASEEQQKEWKKNISAFQEKVFERLDDSRIIATHTSRTITTDKDGNYNGSFTVPSALDNRAFETLVAYGYSAEAEKGAKAKSKAGIRQALVRAGFWATLPVGGLVAGGALLVGEVAYELTEAKVSALKNVDVGKSKHGCNFPNNEMIVQSYAVSEKAFNSQGGGFQGANFEGLPPVAIIAGGAFAFLIIGRLLR